MGLGISLLAVVLAAVYAVQPPSPVPADAAPTEFSAERAMQHIRLFAVEPHPAGTPAADRVSEYILRALGEMGIHAEVDTATVAGRTDISEVRNVLARIPGTASTRAFALFAHYDSTPYGPGAADAGSGVATMLETARAIKAGPPLMNDVLLVFTDGEERGLTGARAFVRHPWAREVGVLLNMETRGTSGPAGMFETTPNNGWLIRQLIQSGASVRASSLSYDIYKHMPTKTDLTVLREHRLKGYNIAFIEDFPYYHTPNDNPDHLSLSSLQHNGSYALNLARHFGNMPLDNIPKEPDSIFFNVFGPIMVQYAASLGWPLAILVCLTFFGVAVLGIRRGRLTMRGIRSGLGVVLLAAGLAALISTAIMVIAYRLHYVYVLYNARTIAPTLIAITVLAAGLVFRAYNNKVTTADLVSGALAWWLVALVVLQIALPHGACVALWPMLAGSFGLILLVTGPANLSGRRVWLHALSAVPGILLMAQFMRGMTASLTILMAPLLMAPLVLFLGLLAPQLRYIFKSVPTRALLLLIALLSLVILITTGGAHAPNTPVMNSVSYGLDRTTGQAWWISTDKAPDEWTSQFFPPGTKKKSLREFVPFDRAPRLKAPAPVVELAPPTVEVISDTRRNDGSRDVSLRLTSPRRVPEIRFYIDAPTRVLQATVDGRQIRVGRFSSSRGGWWFHYEIFPRSGEATVDLVIEGKGPVTGRVLEKSYELPPVPYAPRPPYMINKSNSLDWFEKNRFTSGHSYVVTPVSF
ncbi:MAG TPA: M20/M25/M40 family metallo-hydrolase [Candidatus Bathyarchaeia archaeon]|nr:M20/M25/M40 family metallo-hydrolase [Candidatus Bathyarchaeia archaeon]